MDQFKFEGAVITRSFIRTRERFKGNFVSDCC